MEIQECVNTECELYDENAEQNCGGDTGGEPAIASCRHSQVVRPLNALTQLPPMDDELRWIMGRPNFTLAGYAQRLRMLGQEIAYRAEDEQAAVIYWMVNLYLEHGESWRDEAKKELGGARP